jgi:predicted nuclease of predicted toxin-antitoxin system
MPLLLADENFPMPAVMALRRLGYDVLTLLEAALAGSAFPDDEVLQLATAQQRCLLTLNRKDFIKLHSLQPEHAGIVICKVDADFVALANRVDACLRQQIEPIGGQLLRVQRTQL